MTVCVIRHPMEDVAVGFDPTQERIATWAEKASNMSARMAMVNEQIALDSTDQALSVLGQAHGFNIVRGQSIFALESRSEILCASGLRIGPPPLPQALIAALFVLLPVVTSLRVSAFLAVGAQRRAVDAARLGVSIQGEIALALATSFHIHTSSMAYQRGITWRRADDQSCHADVLLELANGTKP